MIRREVLKMNHSLASATLLSVVSDSAPSWTVAHQAPLPTGFSRQEDWSGLPFSPPGDLPDPGIKPVSLMSPALAGRLFTTSATWEAQQSVLLQYVLLTQINSHVGFPGGATGKTPPAHAGDTGDVGWIPGSGKPLATHSSILAWKAHGQGSLDLQATAHGVTISQT